MKRSKTDRLVIRRARFPRSVSVDFVTHRYALLLISY